MNELIAGVKRAVSGLDIDGITGAVRACLEGGVEPWEIIREGMSAGMMEVGARFEAGEYFLAELIMAGEIVKDGMRLLEGRIGAHASGKRDTIVMATVRGDIHDIGKNIVGMMLSAGGYNVVDLGNDVDEKTIVKAVKEHGARGVGLSALLTTMIGSIRDTVDALSRAGLRDKVKIAIGGACTSEKLAHEMGVDAYGADAVQAVRIFNELLAS